MLPRVQLAAPRQAERTPEAGLPVCTSSPRGAQHSPRSRSRSRSRASSTPRARATEQRVHRASHSCPAPLEHVGVDLCGLTSLCRPRGQGGDKNKHLEPDR